MWVETQARDRHDMEATTQARRTWMWELIMCCVMPRHVQDLFCSLGSSGGVHVGSRPSASNLEEDRERGPSRQRETQEAKAAHVAATRDGVARPPGRPASATG